MRRSENTLCRSWRKYCLAGQEVGIWGSRDDPVRGDQFEQRDRRVTLGLKASQTWFGELFARKTENTLGLQVRSDNIRNGLFKTQNRNRLTVTREDHVNETSVDVLNLFDERSSDIDYYYTSRLRGEPSAGVDDRHTHPNEPRSVRFTISARF